MEWYFQIFVGGPTLAIGYLNRPELNQEKFITRPKNVDTKVGDRLYRTGDWGYVLSDGSFEICGRCDSMVKIRGYTVELQVSVFLYVTERSCLMKIWKTNILEHNHIPVNSTSM